MTIDNETVTKLRSILKWGDRAEVARRLKLTPTAISDKINGIIPMNENDARVIVQVVKERERKEKKIMKSLKSVINE